MTSAGLTCPSIHAVAIELDAQTSSRLLERAHRSRSQGTLVFTQCEQPCEVTVEIESTDAQTMHLATQQKDAIVNMLPSTCLEVRFGLDGQEYFFASTAIECRDSQIVVGRPEQLHTWQRRRFLRASVAESAVVVLTEMGGSRHVRGEGAMLNVSQDGLACRLTREVADRVDINEMVGVKFELGPEHSLVECCGRIKSKTAAGSTNAIIVGIQLDRNPDTSNPLNQLLNA